MWFKYSEDTLVTLKLGNEERRFRAPAHTCKSCGEVVVETRPPTVEMPEMKADHRIHWTLESGKEEQ